MRILGGLLGGNNSVKQALQDLLRELSGDGVSSKVWDSCRTADTLEDFIDDELPRERLVALAAAHPKNVYGLALLCVESMEAALALEGESFDEPAEISLANSMTVLCHLIAAGPAGGSAPPGAANTSPHTGSLAENAIRPEHPLIGLLWDAPTAAGKEVAGKQTQWFSLDENPPLAERILNATMRSLFFDGFTIDLKDKDEDAAGSAQRDVDPTLLWSGHIGPESDFEQEPADDEVRENRTLALQLLLAMVCGAAPAIALKELADQEAKAAAAKPQQRGRTSQRGQSKEDKAALLEAAAVASQAVSKPLIMDLRALAYLQNPERSIPYRAELLYSLLSVSLDYNPRGMGVPLAGFFRGSKEESFISVSMQVLALLLQDARENECLVESAIVSRRPQELLGHPEAWPLPPASPDHLFRRSLADLTSDREVAFIFSGIVNLLGTINEEQRAYIPGSVRVPSFLPELLVLVFHLAAMDSFVKGFCRNEDCGAPAMAEVLVAHAFQETPEHLHEDFIPAIAVAALLRLTAYREFCDQLNEAFDGDQPDELPEFTGNFADAVALAVLKQASDKIQYAQVSNVSWCTVEAALCTMDNISTFTEGFCMESCFRLFALLERCGKASMVKRGRTGLALWMPRVLEAIQNAVQYQYAPNTDMIYGLMTRQALLLELEGLAAKAVPSKAEASSEEAREAKKSENGHSVPADGDEKPMSAASTSDEALPEMPAEWWAAIKASLEPIAMLLREVTPHVEAEVERREIASPEEAKKFLPRTALGLLPVPHAFVTRSLKGNAVTHRICEHCLVASVAHGPIGGLWEESEDAGDSAGSDHKEPEEEKPKPSKKGASDRKRSSSRRARSVERTRSRDPRDRRSPPRGAVSSTGAAQPSAANPLPADPAAALKAQLEAAAAAGVDVNMLLQQLTQGAAAAAASAAPAPAAPAPAAPAAPAAPSSEGATTSEPSASASATPPPPPVPPAPEEKADQPTPSAAGNAAEAVGGAQADAEPGI